MDQLLKGQRHEIFILECCIVKLSHLEEPLIGWHAKTSSNKESVSRRNSNSTLHFEN